MRLLAGALSRDQAGPIDPEEPPPEPQAPNPIEPSNEPSVGVGTGQRLLYVTGNNSNPLDTTLTPDLKFSTLQAALNAAAAGDVILVKSGTARARPTITNKAGTVDLPIWVVAEERGKALVSDCWPEADLATQSWTSLGGGLFRAAHGQVFMGEDRVTGDYLQFYKNQGDLLAPSLTINGQQVIKPTYGFACADGFVFVRLRGDANPNGRSLKFSETFGRDTWTLNNADNVIIDGFIIEGAGNANAITIQENCANPTIRNCVFRYSKFGVRAPSNTIIESCQYLYPGFEKWAREIKELNGAASDALFELVNRYFTDSVIGGTSGNALLEGGMELGYATTATALTVDNCIVGPTFRGSRFGEFDDSECKNTIFLQCMDDGIQMGSSRATNASDGLEVHDCRFIDCFFGIAHQSANINGEQHIFRNVFEVVDTVLVHPAGFIKTLSTPLTADIHYYHNLFRNRGALGNDGFGTDKWIWQDSSNANSDRILNFFNNIILSPDKLDNGPGPNPASVTNNVLVAPAANALFTGTGGLFVGTTVDAMQLNADFSLKSASPARNKGKALPSGFPDSRTQANKNADCGAFVFGEQPGPDWPRTRRRIFFQTIPQRWTSPGPAVEAGAPFPKPVFGGNFAPWAIPAAGLPTHPNSAALVDDIYDIVPGQFNLNHQRFSPAIYDLADANTTVTLGSGLTNSNLAAGSQIPWNKTKFITPQDFDASDGDSYTILVDFTTGLCFEFFESNFNPGTNTLDCQSARIIKAGVELTGANGNVLFKENVFRVTRACGIQHVVGLVLRSEVDQGVIPHCMTLLWPNPTAGAHEAPAIKGAGATGGGANRGFMGLRIVWDGLTDTDINNWLATRPAATRPVMRMIAECLRTYGAIGTDHGGNAGTQRGATQLEHSLTGKWGDFGITHASSLTALDTLLGPAQAKARVIDIPDHVGGSDANVACYPGVTYPPGHPCNGA